MPYAKQDETTNPPFQVVKGELGVWAMDDPPRAIFYVLAETQDGFETSPAVLHSRQEVQTLIASLQSWLDNTSD